MKNYNEQELEKVLQVVSEELQFPISLLRGKWRKREVSDARQMFCYAAYQFTKQSKNDIATYLSGRDHATVIHSIRSIKNIIDSDKTVLEVWNKVKKQLFSKGFRIERTDERIFLYFQGDTKALNRKLREYHKPLKSA